MGRVRRRALATLASIEGLRCIATLAIILTTFSGCTGDEMSDLDAFITNKQAKPGSTIKSIPTVNAYEAFVYMATTMRSPFDRPVKVHQANRSNTRSVVKPDLNRTKEFLEQFILDSLQIVGHIEYDNQRWALIRDPKGSIHRIQAGNYLGLNYGQVIDVGETFVVVMELVPSDTTEGWIERRRKIEP